MKNPGYILLASMLMCVTSVCFGQNSKQELKDAEKKAADERSRSFGGKKTQSTLGAKKQIGEEGQNKNSEASETNETSPVISSNKDQDKSKETTGTNTNPERSNSPGVVESTTSEAGSPAILSENDGEGRDGTNTRQRATYKMAGAEIKGDLGLSENDGSEKNMKAPKV